MLHGLETHRGLAQELWLSAIEKWRDGTEK
jgi:hypothetical protein